MPRDASNGYGWNAIGPPLKRSVARRAAPGVVIFVQNLSQARNIPPGSSTAVRTTNTFYQRHSIPWHAPCNRFEELLPQFVRDPLKFGGGDRCTSAHAWRFRVRHTKARREPARALHARRVDLYDFVDQRRRSTNRRTRACGCAGTSDRRVALG